MAGTPFDMQKPRQSRTKAILAAGILAFIVIAAGAALLCHSYAEYEAQAILNRQRDVLQTLLDKTLDAIRVWRVELVNQARFISSSEMLRMFITDTRDLSPQELKTLSAPEALHSEDEDVRALAEQRVYIQDLLRDFVRRRSWSDARLISLSGQEILESQMAAPLDEAQKNLVERAKESKLAIFGPIRRVKDQFFMDMADPLFEVLGNEDLKCVAVLLLSVPVEKPLKSFLGASAGQDEHIYPSIVDQTPHSTALISLSGNHLSLSTLDKPLPRESLAFGLRHGIGSPQESANGQEVYSLGARPTLLDWLLILETPENVLNAIIHASTFKIYAIGALATLGLTLLVAFLFAHFTSRQHKARAAHLNNLYNMIRQQKLLLDGVNNSLEAGLLLVDDKGVIQMANPAFLEMVAGNFSSVEGLLLTDVLPGQTGIELVGNVRNVENSDQSKTVELTCPGKAGDRLYRVTLFPYHSEEGEAISSGRGCVAIFQDITQFRANAKKAAQRQEALLTAMDRAIESADPNLVGQSPKMAALCKLLAEQLGLDGAQQETLRIASLLSQVGKLFVPRELLLKQGNLTPEEKREVARAPEYADRILTDLHFDLPVRETVLEMGERMDGSGPRGMKGDQISMAGRVLAAISAFVAMTSKRAWRKKGGMSPEEAIRLLRDDKRFDPRVTAALAKIDPVMLKQLLAMK